jgi:hypothetical protein
VLKKMSASRTFIATRTAEKRYAEFLEHRRRMREPRAAAVQIQTMICRKKNESAA